MTDGSNLKLLKKAIVDRQKRPWRYYKLEREDLYRALESRDARISTLSRELDEQVHAGRACSTAAKLYERQAEQLDDQLEVERGITAEVEWADANGCFSGDCPHGHYMDCMSALKADYEHGREIIQKARSAAAESAPKGD